MKTRNIALVLFAGVALLVTSCINEKDYFLTGLGKDDIAFKIGSVQTKKRLFQLNQLRPSSSVTKMPLRLKSRLFQWTIFPSQREPRPSRKTLSPFTDHLML